MKPLIIQHKFSPRGKIFLSGDKSIAHRALIVSALTCDKTVIKNFPFHDDSLATINALCALGVKINCSKDKVTVFGRDRGILSKPDGPVSAGNSGTTMRLLLGVLAGQPFKTRFIAGKYLSRRPMARVNLPLRKMGARIFSRIKNSEEYAPITILGGKLRAISYCPQVSSAQVKSAVLLAGLFACGKTKVIERIPTRDHTERMLKIFGADLVIKNKNVILNPVKKLSSPGQIYIPADISSAAFFIVLACIIPLSRIELKCVCLNPSRIGILNVLKRMGARIKISNLKCRDFEPFGNLTVSSGPKKLKGTVIKTKEIPSLIDELPIIMVAACFAAGRTLIEGAEELRVKETDRINSMVSNLKRMGARIEIRKVKSAENILIEGMERLKGAELKSFGDHRSAMSLIIAALAAQGQSKIDDVACINKSFPRFLEILNCLSA